MGLDQFAPYEAWAAKESLIGCDQPWVMSRLTVSGYVAQRNQITLAKTN